MKRPSSRESGFTFLELMISFAVIVTASAVLMGQLAMNYVSTRKQKNRVFAFMAAKSMLAEIHAYARSTDSSGEPNDVDNLDDGVAHVPTLSIATKNGTLVPPDHDISRNHLRGSSWAWSRQISVRPLPGIDNRKLRYVTVRIFRKNSSGDDKLEVSLSSVVNSLAQGFATTQVFDIYFLAIENIPGWWVHMETIRPFTESMVTELERSNPGLEVRSHWITKLGFGRNRAYRPYTNVTVDSHTAVPYVYYYPGLMPSGNASTNYYVPSMINARIATELGERNGYNALTNPYPYALADRFNHCMRYPRAVQYFEDRRDVVQARRQAIKQAQADGTPPPVPLSDMSVEPTMRLFFDDLSKNPDKYRNALIVNLHGELMPMAPLRNYSDAAKDPFELPHVRVAVHPEEIRTQRPPSSDPTDARIRVYAYTDDPTGYGGPAVMPIDRPIAIQIMDLDLTDGSGGLAPGVSLENLAGGVMVGGTAEYQAWATAKPFGTELPDEMSYATTFVDPGAGLRKFTLLMLYQTPVVAPEVSTRGVFATSRGRLYGMDYVPTPTGINADYSRDLYSTGEAPKNTARWVITIPGTVFADQRWVDTASPPNRFDPNLTTDPDRVLTIRTRIWNPNLPVPLFSGSWPEGMTNMVIQPDNFSETYTWWAGTKDAVPMSERSQFLGDPRHNPYKDLMNVAGADFPNGYNWYFDSLQNTNDAAADFPTIDGTRLGDGWLGRLRQDLPRFFEWTRKGFVDSECLYTTMTGWSYYYVGFGNEIGYDSANGYANSIPSDLTAFGQPGTTGYINTITGARTLVRRGDTGYWWSIPWLGELYPDDQYVSQWLANDSFGQIAGNLLAGTATDRFYQQDEQSVYAGSLRGTYGTALSTMLQRTQKEGCTSFFNIGTSTATFHHQSGSFTGTLEGPGLEIANNYSIDLPATTPFSRPFVTADSTSGGVGSEWNFSPYSTERYSGTLLRTYYGVPGSPTGSGLIELADPAGTRAAHIVVNGIAQTTDVGTSLISKYSLLALVHSFFETGDAAMTHRTKMTPRVEILHPTEITELTDPTDIDIRFDIAWKRWDGEPYTGTTSTTFAEDDTEIVYVVLYSRNSGRTWLHIQDDAIADPGTLPENPTYVMGDTTSGQETFNWAVPSADYPAGSYMLRVECYRTGQSLHYAYHQKKIFIDR